jgi:uncharacterized protein
MSNPEIAINPPTPEASDLDSARASLQQSLARYASRQVGAISPTLQKDLDTLAHTLTKLDQSIYSIAVFGLVSRGKSAVLNALIGQKILETGPLNGVTRFPRSVRWSPDGIIQIDLIDTPGLDEIEGEARAEMAAEVVRQADLILFIIAGDITQLEYQFLCELRQAQKPLLLVFNKADLYPEREQQIIYQQLQSLSGSGDNVSEELLQRLLSADEVVMVAADPTAIQVRIEYADGTIKNEWEKPAPQIAALQHKIQELFAREGRSLLAINALVQARSAESNLAKGTLVTMQGEAKALIWKFAQYKAIAVAINPVVVFDVLGGVFIDLLLIRSLAKLYNLPMTNYEISKLLSGILFSGGSLLLGELMTSVIFGVGKAATLLDPGFNVADLPNYLIASAIQGAIAGYGAYSVGTASQVYLEAGCTWGQLGANTIMKQILDRVDDATIISRLRDELLPPPVENISPKSGVKSVPATDHSVSV